MGRDDYREDCCDGAMPGTRERSMRRGDTLPFTIQVVRNLRTGAFGAAWPGERFPRDCVAVDLTGWRVLVTAKYELPDWDSEAVFQLDNQLLGGVVAAGTEGIVQVTVPKGATVGFADGPTRLVYDVAGFDASAAEHTPEHGVLTVVPSALRSG